MKWTFQSGTRFADGTRDSWDMWRCKSNYALSIVRRDEAFPPRKEGYNQPFWSEVGVWRIHFDASRVEDTYEDLPLTMSLEDVQAVAITSARFRGMTLRSEE